VKKNQLICIVLLSFSLFVNNLYALDKADMLKKVLTSMVTIYSVNNISSSELDLFFKSSQPAGSTGSGVIVDSKGIVITNKHVLLPNSKIKVVLYDGRVYPANIIKMDETLDLALLRIDFNSNEVFNPINIISSDNIQVGDDIFAIGNPFGVGISVTSGIVSALPNNNLVSSKIGNVIQTDAVMNPGNSGGALINQKGDLLGINTSILSKTGTFSGISFAIPSNTVKLFIDRTLSGKKVKQYWFGMSAVNVNNELAKKYGLDRATGVIIAVVYKGGPASRAGLKVGDIILAVGDKKITSINDLGYIAASIDREQTLLFQVFSNYESYVKEVVAQEPQYNVPSEITNVEDGLFKGIVVANNSHALSYEMGIGYVENTVVIYDITKGSTLEKLGIKKSDIIFSLNGIRVANVNDFMKKISKNQDQEDYNMVIRRQSNEINIYLRKR